MRIKLTVIPGHIPHFWFYRRGNKWLKTVPGFDVFYVKGLR